VDPGARLRRCQRDAQAAYRRQRSSHDRWLEYDLSHDNFSFLEACCSVIMKFGCRKSYLLDR
jgi:hypothetical protein